MLAKSITSVLCYKEWIAGHTEIAKNAHPTILYNYCMKIHCRLALLFSLLLCACQPKVSSTATILDNKRIITLQTEERVPAALLSQAGIVLGKDDRILVNGFPAQLNQLIPNYPITLQIRHALNIIINTPQGQKQIFTD